ncbi:hypothetical protein BJV78DRAFT_1209381 [Lactifluus subvellereus]|nr:hypothetical protein BJV78DRAFT_1209381 [Lactifluus subvellereus]
MDPGPYWSPTTFGPFSEAELTVHRPLKCNDTAAWNRSLLQQMILYSHLLKTSALHSIDSREVDKTVSAECLSSHVP